MLQLKIVSSLEKAFLDQRIEEFPTLESISALRGERISVQCLFYRPYEVEADAHLLFAIPKISGPLAPYVKLHRVRSVPVAKTKFPTTPTDSFLRTAPGLYPDILEPMDGERLTTQFVDVKKTNGRYFFSYKKLDRWIDMCDRVGIEFFEISHLFTQWGAEHAPKIMATVDGEYKKIFGWETDAAGEEYGAFLRCFLKSFLKHMKARGDDMRCFFHISDEPTEPQLESYKKAKAQVKRILKGYPIMDALSDFSFYKKGSAICPSLQTIILIHLSRQACRTFGSITAAVRMTRFPTVLLRRDPA